MQLFIDRVHRLPRLWSNQELARFAPLFAGEVVNVSAWKDIDKFGRRYRDYFTAASSYTITNFRPEARGFQGGPGEIFLDLEQTLDPALQRRFDVVFNHTTLEHIYGLQQAFANLCAMSRDAVILVLPFLQQYHADYGDFWRVSPEALRRMFEANGLTLVYQSFNTHRQASVYTFSIAVRDPAVWQGRLPSWTFSSTDPGTRRAEPYLGCHALANWGYRFLRAPFNRACSLLGRAGRDDR